MLKHSLLVILFNSNYFFSVEPADYSGVRILLTFGPLTQRMGVPVPIINDLIVEGNETFFGLLDSQGEPVITNPAQATVLITEDMNDSKL